MKRLFFKWKGFTLNEKDLHNEKLEGKLDEKDLLFYEKVFQKKRFSTFLSTWKRNEMKRKLFLPTHILGHHFGCMDV